MAAGGRRRLLGLSCAPGRTRVSGDSMNADTQSLVFADKEELKKELKLADPTRITVDPAADADLEAQADALVGRLVDIAADDQDGQTQAKAAVETMGIQLQKEAARRSQMLQQPVKKLSDQSGDGGQVANALIDLKVQVEALDPAKFDLEAGWFSRALGYLPGIGTPLKRYFTRYEAASTVIDAVMNSLKSGQDQLKRDNITLADDQKQMRALGHKLERAIKLGELIDRKLQERVATELVSDDPRTVFVQEELLFPLRQRIQDLQQQLLVNQQGFLTIEMIVRNNKELIRGVNRALNVTVSALQVAVTLALALANQKIVLEKVQAVTKTTETLIAGTAERLKTQGAEIHKQAAGTALDLDVLRQSFADIRAALDDVSRYRQEALPKMAENIVEMDRMAAESEQTIQRMEGAAASARDFPIEIID
ncbi:MAG: toxic anion resistance protein [Zoogloeaceae bacterium]|nr:toxic anion resistance protein [Zoogloeaceae bacterium]